jgi:hypothetical protein
MDRFSRLDSAGFSNTGSSPFNIALEMDSIYNEKGVNILTIKQEVTDG